jgi:hypothetical protein
MNGLRLGGGGGIKKMGFAETKDVENAFIQSREGDIANA